MSAPMLLAAQPPRAMVLPPPRWVARAAVGLASVAIASGLTFDAARTWSDLLVNGFFVLAAALGGLVFVAIHHLSGASWSAGVRRVGEAMTGALPVAALMMLGLFFGRRSLYPWAAGAVSALRESGPSSSWYFATPLVFARMALFLIVWTVLAASIVRSSGKQDLSADPVHRRRMVRDSALFTVVFAWTFSLASADWLLSLDPRWTSTIFAVYVFAGVFVEGIAAITLAVVLLRERGYLADVVTEHHLHDLGKLLFAFTTFWAYIWLSQYLLIWYGNLPDEAGYYQVRTSPAWIVWFAVNLIVNWVIPFLVLLPRESKRRLSVLKRVAIVVLVGRWLDVYLLVAPQTTKTPAFGLLEVALAVAYAGIAWYAVGSMLARRPLVARHDPCLADCLRHRQ
jgi:hypothetical protein